MDRVHRVRPWTWGPCFVKPDFHMSCNGLPHGRNGRESRTRFNFPDHYDRVADRLQTVADHMEIRLICPLLQRVVCLCFESKSVSLHT